MRMRCRRGVPLSRERQWYILGMSLGYKQLPAIQRERIDALCLACGGRNGQALREYVTTEATARAVCTAHYIASETTLYRAARRYFMRFDLDKKAE